MEEFFFLAAKIQYDFMSDKLKHTHKYIETVLCVIFSRLAVLEIIQLIYSMKKLERPHRVTSRIYKVV